MAFKAITGFNQYLRTRDDPEATEKIDNPFHDPDFGEALRCLDIEFKILAIGKVTETYPYPDRPPVHFRGRVIVDQDDDDGPGDAQDSTIVGTVTMTGDGEVRWAFGGYK